VVPAPAAASENNKDNNIGEATTVIASATAIVGVGVMALAIRKLKNFFGNKEDKNSASLNDGDLETEFSDGGISTEYVEMNKYLEPHKPGSGNFSASESSSASGKSSGSEKSSASESPSVSANPSVAASSVSQLFEAKTKGNSTSL
jgi:hypothetical protein